jgi:hypothetical protein
MATPPPPLRPANKIATSWKAYFYLVCDDHATFERKRDYGTSFDASEQQASTHGAPSYKDHSKGVLEYREKESAHGPPSYADHVNGCSNTEKERSYMGPPPTGLDACWSGVQ